MPHALALRQRVAVVDPVPRTREYARRAIRGLGHAPLVFTDVEELLTVGRTAQRYALMCFGVPVGVQDLRRLVDLSREIVGRDVPVMFVAAGSNARALKNLGRIQRDELLTTSSSFSDIYNALEGFMIRHGLPLADDGLAWGRYSFHPACALTRVSGTDVWLEAPEFELALEFFHNVDRPLSSEWLRGMVSRPTGRSWTRWLDTRVDHLRRQLDLGSARGWGAADARCRGYRLSSVMGKKRLSPDFAIERCFQT